MWRYGEVWRPNGKIWRGVDVDLKFECGYMWRCCEDRMWRYGEVWRPYVEIYVEVWRPNEELAYIVQNGKNDRSYLLVTTPKFV